MYSKKETIMIVSCCQAFVAENSKRWLTGYIRVLYNQMPVNKEVQ